MIKSKRTIFILSAYILLDIVFAVLSFWLACYIRQGTLPFPVTFENLFLIESNPFRLISFLWIFVVVLVNHGHGLYRTRREVFETLEIGEVVKSVFLASFMTVVMIYALKIQDFPRTVLGLTTVLMMLSFSLWRMAKRFFVRYLVARGYNNFNILVIGAGKVGRALAEEIQKRPELGLRIVGFLDDFAAENQPDSGPKVIGKISDLPGIVPREFVNMVFVASQPDSAIFLNILTQSRELGIAVRVVPQGFELASGEFSKYNIGLIPVLEYGDNFRIRKQAGKRFFDFVVSLILFFCLLPLFVVLALLIKLGSPGPVIYRSQRYGRGGKKFAMYKFRSMVVNADEMLDTLRKKNEVDGPIFKIRQDPRVTGIGKVLRRYSLDELPQILNVLKGEMSLVGPRPLPIAQIEKEDLRQLKRLEVRPGISGLWQVRGRSDISFEKLVDWDIWYINNWSFWLDVSILLQTIPVVLKGQGAY